MKMRVLLVLVSCVLSVVTGLVLSRGGAAATETTEKKGVVIGLSLDTLKEARWQTDRASQVLQRVPRHDPRRSRHLAGDPACLTGGELACRRRLGILVVGAAEARQRCGAQSAADECKECAPAALGYGHRAPTFEVTSHLPSTGHPRPAPLNQ